MKWPSGGVAKWQRDNVRPREALGHSTTLPLRGLSLPQITHSASYGEFTACANWYVFIFLIGGE